MWPSRTQKSASQKAAPPEWKTRRRAAMTLNRFLQACWALISVLTILLPNPCLCLPASAVCILITHIFIHIFLPHIHSSLSQSKKEKKGQPRWRIRRFYTSLYIQKHYTQFGRNSSWFFVDIWHHRPMTLKINLVSKNIQLCCWEHLAVVSGGKSI